MSAINTSLKPRFRMGYEVEGLIAHSARPGLGRFLTTLYEGLAEIGQDGSLRIQDADPQWSREFGGIEIKTPPLPAFKSMDKLQQLFEYLQDLEGKQLFLTNDTCGFHVNVSECRIFTSQRQEKINNLAFLFLKSFKTGTWLKAFNRAANRYTAWNGAPSDLDDMIRNEHYSRHHTALNIAKIGLAEAAERRIEIRCAGNANYHRHPKMEDYLKHVFSTLSSCVRKVQDSF